MAQDNKIYVIGHQDPHTDSVASAIAYAAYMCEKGFEAIPCVLGRINKESQYVLERFGFETPRLLETAQVQLNEVDLDPPDAITPDTTMYSAVRLMRKTKRENFAVVDDEHKLVGWVSKTDLAEIAISDTKDAHGMIRETPLENYAKTLKGKILYEASIRHLDGKVSIITPTGDPSLDNYELTDRIAIIGGDEEIIERVIKKGAGMIILIWKDSVSDEIMQIARQHHCSILTSGFGAVNTLRYMYFAPSVDMMMTKNPMKFYEYELAEDAGRKMARTRFRSYPVVDVDNHLVGYATRFHILNYSDKQLILVDHNEFSQSVKGIEKARVLQVLDHHKVTDFNTARPVNFRNEIVGSTCTIVATIFRENQVPMDENLAGLMLAGLLSDTMNLQTPTTTPRDRQTANILAAVAGLDLDQFAEELFSVTEDEGGSMEELMMKDIYFEDEYGMRLMICKLNVPSVDMYRNRADEIQQALDHLTHNKNSDLGVLSITSALENRSILFASGDKGEWLFEAFPNEDGNPHSVHEGLVSRKMQIMPQLLNVISKYA